MKDIVKIMIVVLMPLYLSTTVVAQDQDRSVTYSVEAPKEVAVGQNIDISVTFNMKTGWHIYAPNRANEAKGYIVSTIGFTAPEGMTADEVQIPTPSNSITGQVYKGSGIVMKQSLMSTKGLAPGKHKIKGTVTYQACNIDYCEPPQSFPVILRINVVEKHVEK